MSKEFSNGKEKSLPVCRLAMLASSCVITLVGVVNGLDPYVVFSRVVIGSMFVGVAMFFIHLWFSSMFA